MSIEIFLIKNKNIIMSLKKVYSCVQNLFNNTNKIFVVDRFGHKKQVHRLKNFNVKFEGYDNVIIIDSTVKFEKIHGIISGNNNKLIVGKNCIFYQDVCIDMCCNRSNRKIVIEDDVSIIQAEFHCWGNDSIIHVKRDCMFSSEVKIKNSDGHPIFDRDTGKIINDGKFVVIGEHCWLGQGSEVLKNVEIASNSVIGAKSVVTKSLKEENCVYAGIPAKIVRRNIDWSKENS